MNKSTLGLLASFTLMSGVAFAAETQDATENAPEANPACSEAPFRDFDFWVGTWDVHTPAGQLAGRNVISSEEGGCLLVERWTSASGGTGQSYNYVDLDTGEWRQIWVSPGMTINYAGGLDENGVMRLEGRIAYGAAPQNNGPFRGAWELKEDGTVEQTFHQQNPETEEWVPWFTGIYSKVEAKK